MIGVKGVFKTLIWTIFGICIVALFIEYLNITASTTFLTGIMNRSVERAADYFAQETYKNRDYGLAGNMRSLNGIDENGDPSIYTISGTFYTGSEEDVYNKLYGEDSSFADWYNSIYVSARNRGEVYWQNLEMLASGLGLGNTRNLTAAQKENGKTYAEEHMTPLNLGIPYLDDDTVEKIAAWNIANTLSEGKESLLHYETNSDGNLAKYVLYKGFRIYPADIDVDVTNFEVYDVTERDQQIAFEQATNMDLAMFDQVIDDGGLIDDERRYVGVVDIQYTVPMEYVGVTPMRNIINFMANRKQVAGYGNNSYTPGANVVDWGEPDPMDTYNSAVPNDGSQKIRLEHSMKYYIVR